MSKFSLVDNSMHSIINGLIVTFAFAFIAYYADTVQHDTDAGFAIIGAPLIGLMALGISFILGLILVFLSKHLEKKSHTMNRLWILLAYTPTILMAIVVLVVMQNNNPL